MDATAAVTLLGGLGLFLLGIHHLTEGLKGLGRRLATPSAPKTRCRPIQRGGIRRALHGGDSILNRGNPHRHRLRQRGTGHLPAGDRGHHGCDARNDLDAVDGGAVRFSRQHRSLCQAHPRRRRLSLGDRKGENAIAGSDPRGLRTDLYRDRIPSKGDGRHFLESRGVRGNGLRLDVDSRRDRGHYDDRHAELERCRCDDTRGTACGLADVRTRLRDDRRAERRIGSDDRAGGDRRRPRGAALGAGAHHFQCDRWRSRDAVSRTANGSGRLGGGST